MMHYSRSQLARAFVHLHDLYPMGPLVQVLAQELVRSHRMVDVDGVVAEISRHLLEMRKTLLAEVVSARPLPSATLQTLKKMLAAATGATAVRLETTVDPKLIGGCVVRAPGLELDASLTGRLKLLTTL